MAWESHIDTHSHGNHLLQNRAATPTKYRFKQLEIGLKVILPKNLWQKRRRQKRGSCSCALGTNSRASSTQMEAKEAPGSSNKRTSATARTGGRLRASFSNMDSKWFQAVLVLFFHEFCFICGCFFILLIPVDWIPQIGELIHVDFFCPTLSSTLQPWGFHHCSTARIVMGRALQRLGWRFIAQWAQNGWRHMFRISMIVPLPCIWVHMVSLYLWSNMQRCHSNQYEVFKVWYGFE